MMPIEREVLVSILKTTADGTARIEDVSQEVRVPLKIVRYVLEGNSKIGIIQLRGNLVAVNGEQRLKIALKAIESGADIERVCSFLSWKEFEDIVFWAFEANDFSVKKHFRFSSFGRRWEIDILGFKEPIVVSADCKHWRHGWRDAASLKAVKSQIERTKALVETSLSLSERMGIKEWRLVYFIPLILSLVPSAFKFYEKTPIVPVLQLRDFLQDMPAYVHEITHFRKTLSNS